jgi:hypothetical protein
VRRTTMAEKPTKEERAGKGPRVDMDQIADRMQASLAAGAPPPPADTTQPVHTEEEDEPAMTNDNASIIEQVNNRGEGMSQVRERPSALATSTNPIEELVDSQTRAQARTEEKEPEGVWPVLDPKKPRITVVPVAIDGATFDQRWAPIVPAAKGDRLDRRR